MLDFIAMKTEEAVRRAGSRNALAKLLRITGAAVSQWGEDVPELRMWQLKAKKPHWFRKPKQVAEAA